MNTEAFGVIEKYYSSIATKGGKVQGIQQLPHSFHIPVISVATLNEMKIRVIAGIEHVAAAAGTAAAVNNGGGWYCIRFRKERRVLFAKD